MSISGPRWAADLSLGAVAGIPKHNGVVVALAWGADHRALASYHSLGESDPRHPIKEEALGKRLGCNRRGGRRRTADHLVSSWRLALLPDCGSGVPRHYSWRCKRDPLPGCEGPASQPGFCGRPLSPCSRCPISILVRELMVRPCDGLQHSRQALLRLPEQFARQGAAS